MGPTFTGSIYTVAILPVTLFMGLIGLLVTAATGNSDPVVVFSTTMGSKFLTVVTLLFIAFAQVTNQCAEQYRSAILCADGIIPHEMVPRHHPGRNPSRHAVCRGSW